MYNLILLSLCVLRSFCQLNILPISLQNQVGNDGQTTGVVNAPGLSEGRGLGSGFGTLGYPGLGMTGYSGLGMPSLSLFGNPLLSGSSALGTTGYPGLGMAGLGSYGNPLLSGYPGMGGLGSTGYPRPAMSPLSNPLLSGYPGTSGLGMTGYPGLTGSTYPGMSPLTGGTLYPGMTRMYPGAMSPATSSLSLVSAPGVFTEMNVNSCAQGCPSGTYCSTYNGLAHCIPIGGGVGTIF